MTMPIRLFQGGRVPGGAYAFQARPNADDTADGAKRPHQWWKGREEKGREHDSVKGEWGVRET